MFELAWVVLSGVILYAMTHDVGAALATSFIAAFAIVCFCLGRAQGREDR